MTPRPAEQRENNGSSLPSLKSDYLEEHFDDQSVFQLLKNSQNETPGHFFPKFSWAHAVRLKLHNLFLLLRQCVMFPYNIWHELLTNPRFRFKSELPLSRNQLSVLRKRQVAVSAIHILAPIGLYYCLMGKVKLYTVLFAIVMGSLGSIGVTAGAHRLWSHRSYKAKWPLRLILGLLQSSALQFSILNWAVDHRVHHKYVDTDSDPHNSKRGFFYCHVIWSVTAPHAEYLEKRKLVDSRDLRKDWVVKYQFQ